VTKLTIEQVVDLLKHLQTTVVQLTEQLKGKDIEIEMLKSMVMPSEKKTTHNVQTQTQTQTQTPTPTPTPTNHNETDSIAVIEQPVVDTKPSLKLEVAEIQKEVVDTIKV